MDRCSDCESINLKFVRYPMKNGRISLSKQCFTCGCLIFHNHKFAEVDSIADVPMYSEKLREQFRSRKIKISEAKKVLANYTYRRFLKQVEYYRNTYLKSKEWKHKRKMIMDIYNWECQECGSPATDLHHNTYDRIFREKFDDLTPLCRKCHSEKHDDKWEN